MTTVRCTVDKAFCVGDQAAPTHGEYAGTIGTIIAILGDAITLQMRVRDRMTGRTRTITQAYITDDLLKQSTLPLAGVERGEETVAPAADAEAEKAREAEHLDLMKKQAAEQEKAELDAWWRHLLGKAWVAPFGFWQERYAASCRSPRFITVQRRNDILNAVRAYAYMAAEKVPGYPPQFDYPDLLVGQRGELFRWTMGDMDWRVYVPEPAVMTLASDYGTLEVHEHPAVPKGSMVAVPINFTPGGNSYGSAYQALQERISYLETAGGMLAGVALFQAHALHNAGLMTDADYTNAMGTLKATVAMLKDEGAEHSHGHVHGPETHEH